MTLNIFRCFKVIAIKKEDPFVGQILGFLGNGDRSIREVRNGYSFLLLKAFNLSIMLMIGGANKNEIAI